MIRTATAILAAIASASCNAPATSRFDWQIRSFEGGVSSTGARSLEPRTPERIARELEELAAGKCVYRSETFAEVLEDSIDKDAYVCLPSPREVFFGAGPSPSDRVVRGVMPHYGLFFGPMQYAVRHSDEGFVVEVRIALEPPRPEDELELPDCSLASELRGPVRCEPSRAPMRSPSLDPCDVRGRFSAKASLHNVEVLARQWSRDVEGYYNRDARAFGLPVRYDFEFVIVGGPMPQRRFDMVVPLWTTCGRTPYFSAMRSGWPLPVVAHEIGHVMGLLDEYEMFSGIVSAYPKTPFPGAEVSRMGLSMREDTKILPLHHYLILRRAFCPEPASRDPFFGLPP